MNRAARFHVAAGCIAAFCAVALGAFGAHGLKPRLPPEQLAIYGTGVTYHFYHALGLVLLGLAARDRQSVMLHWAGGLMLAGVVLFSGSLYLLAVVNVPALGVITPLGGLCWLTAWLCFAVGVLRADRK